MTIAKHNLVFLMSMTLSVKETKIYRHIGNAQEGSSLLKHFLVVNIIIFRL